MLKLVPARSKVRIFLSYRREDTSGYAGRLRADIEKHLRGSQVFLDIDTIPPGKDFPETIQAAIASCHVFIALIGREWLTIMRQREVDLDQDWTKIEVGTAIENKIPIIPVLVDRAVQPRIKDLSEDLDFIAKLQAHEMTDSRWDYDVGKLIAAIRQVVRVPDRQGHRYILIVAATGLAMILSYLAAPNYFSRMFYPAVQLPDTNSSRPSDTSSEPKVPLRAESNVQIFALHPERRISAAEFIEEYGRMATLASPQESGIKNIIDEINRDSDITDLRWAAYILATIEWDTADSFQPIVEKGSRSYFDKYSPETNLGKMLGNTQEGDGYRYRGRGYTQIVGRNMYRKFGEQLNLFGTDNLEEFPENALKREISYRMISLGMKKGLFSGKKLGDYINNSVTDYFQARRIINGLDHAGWISARALQFEIALRGSLEKIP